MQKYFLINQQKITYDVIGSGPAVICLHGLNQNRHIFHFNKFKKTLKKFRKVLVDLPGYGDSDFVKNCSIEDINNIIEQIRLRENLSTVSLCGYCLGGIFALDYTIRFPKNVTNLILIETMIFMPFWLPVVFSPSFGILFDHFNKNQTIMRVVSYLFPCLNNIQNFQHMKYSIKSKNKNINYHYVQMMQKYGKINHITRSKSVFAKVLIILSKKTFRNILLTAQKLHQVINNSKIIYTKNNGHFSYLNDN